MRRSETQTHLKRLGFHYFPDADHYTERDLATWLPELKRLGCTWLVLQAPLGRAIPEYFLMGLIKAGIEPVLHFPLALTSGEQQPEMDILFRSYASWGVRFTILFNRPNLNTSWIASSWTRSDLVERFLDNFIPLATQAINAGLTPLFPPLEPGGDYWDLAFLRAGLAGFARRCPDKVDRIGISALAHTSKRPLSWGAGGPERWPGARPYYTPDGSQDHRGWHIFDWYLAAARAVLGRSLPILLLEAGEAPENGKHTSHTSRSLSIARLLLDIPAEEDQTPLESLPSEVIAGCFWLLTATAQDSNLSHAFFPPQGSPLPAVQSLYSLAQAFGGNGKGGIESKAFNEKSYGPHPTGDRCIAHYLLLPVYEWGVDEWYLDALMPFIRQNQPTLGFSPAEARFAARVTVAGGVQAYPSELLDSLSASGCKVERILPDGTLLASNEAA